MLVDAMKRVQKDTANPHVKLLHFSNWDTVVPLWINRWAKQKPGLRVLEIGAKTTAFKQYKCDYHVLNLYPDKRISNAKYHVGDVCELQAGLGLFDVVLSKDTFEHLLRPWDAAENMVKYVKPGGIVFVMAPFKWRYHPTPIDCFRFTHTGLQYLFERGGWMKKEIAAYWDFPAPIQGSMCNRLDFEPHGNRRRQYSQSVVYCGIKRESQATFQERQLNRNSKYLETGKA